MSRQHGSHRYQSLGCNYKLSRVLNLLVFSRHKTVFQVLKGQIELGIEVQAYNLSTQEAKQEN
jgi:hypothetical protein